MQPGVTESWSEGNLGQPIEPSQSLPHHLNDWFQRPVRGPLNICTLEIELTGSSSPNTDWEATFDEFLRRTLRDTDCVLKINPRLRLALLRCFPDDLTSLVKRLDILWRKEAKSSPLGHLPDLAFQSGVCLEPSENQAEQLAALLQQYHLGENCAPTLS